MLNIGKKLPRLPRHCKPSIHDPLANNFNWQEAPSLGASGVIPFKNEAAGTEGASEHMWEMILLFGTSMGHFDTLVTLYKYIFPMTDCLHWFLAFWLLDPLSSQTWVCLFRFQTAQQKLVYSAKQIPVHEAPIQEMPMFGSDTMQINFVKNQHVVPLILTIIQTIILSKQPTEPATYIIPTILLCKPPTYVAPYFPTILMLHVNVTYSIIFGCKLWGCYI